MSLNISAEGFLPRTIVFLHAASEGESRQGKKGE